MKTLAKLVLISFVYLQSACGQPKTLNGVYAGIQLMPSVTMGGGMERYDEVYLFRPDGTYNNSIEKPDWQTRVTGTYKISGSTVTVTANKGKHRTSTYKIDKKGGIDAGGYFMLHQPVDSKIPQGYFKFSKMSSMGGGSSGMVYVGTARDDGLYFDGKGNFSNERGSATAVIGSNVGGGGSRNSSGQGTYSINKGVLTLKFNDGRTEVHSFFCRPSEKPIMAVIDGDIYFMNDEKEEAERKAAKNRRSSAGNTAATGPAGNNSAINDNKSAAPADAKAVLLKANSLHGGTTLDNLKTIGFTATLQGLLVTSYVDITNKRVRLEARQGNKLIQVEQLEGQSGWQWQQGQMKTLPAVRVSEMSSVFHSGLLGLRKSQINAFSVKSFNKKGAASSVICQLNGKEYAFVFNEQGQMVACGDNAGQGFTTSVYSNLRNSGGLLLPFQEVLTAGGRKTTVTYQSFEVNPNLLESTWRKPQ